LCRLDNYYFVGPKVLNVFFSKKYTAVALHRIIRARAAASQIRQRKKFLDAWRKKMSNGANVWHKIAI